jgi:hypothetical protein
VIYEGNAAEFRLKQLGLDVPMVHDILLYANAEAATYTEFDAPGSSEVARWSRHVRRASEILVPEGWKRYNPDNQPTLVHPSSRWCLIVASGNVNTGVSYGRSTTKNPKGRTFQQAVQENADLVLFALAADMKAELARLRETWVLLTYVNLHGEIQSEVSQPKEMDGEFITDWEHRVLIPRVDPGAGPEGADQGGEEPPSYDFSIARK